jgi:hypothetical protein
MTSLDGLEVRLYGVAGTSILAPSNIHASVWLAETLPMLPRYGLPIDGTTTPYRPSPTHPPVKYHSLFHLLLGSDGLARLLLVHLHALLEHVLQHQSITNSS